MRGGGATPIIVTSKVLKTVLSSVEKENRERVPNGKTEPTPRGKKE